MAAFVGAAVFDGAAVREGVALVVEDGRVAALLPEPEVPGERVVLGGGVLAPGFIDLQVNGGGGVLLNDRPDADGIAAICAAHARLGTTGLMPTLITDTPAVTRTAVAAGLIADGVHVAPATMRAALAAKRGEDAIFLVTDAMPVAGTGLDGFTLGGRRILRRDGRLTLEDGTLAGADIDFPGAIRVLVRAGVPLSLIHI